MSKKGIKAMSKLAAFIAMLIVLVSLAGLFAACKQTIKLDIAETTMYVADTLDLNATTKDEDTLIIWSTDNADVATVKNGKITAVGVGNATITAALENGESATCAVTVLDRTVTISDTQKIVNYDELGADKTVKLTASSSDNGEIKWFTSDRNIATVSSDGTVTFLQPNANTSEVTITAQRGAATATCVITVKCPSIPEDYYILAKQTNANVVADPGKWYYHADGSEYSFDKEPAYGNNGLTVELNKFPSIENKQYFYFRYQPEYTNGTKYTVKFTVTVNVNGEISVGTNSSNGGTTKHSVQAGVAKEIIYSGTVNSSEPFHINLSKINGEITGSVSFDITGLEIKEGEYKEPDEQIKNGYYLTRGDMATTCANPDKWYYMIDPVNAGSTDFTQAKYEDGVVTLALAATLTGNSHQLRIKPDFDANTKITAKFTVKLSAAGTVTYGLNNVAQAERGKVIFGDGQSAVGEEVQITTVLTVSDTVPFVIWIEPADGTGAVTMTVSDVSFAEKLPENYTVAFETNGGSAVEAITVVEGGSINEPTAPTYAGHVFDGWYADENYSEVVNFPYTPSANVTIYAKWIDVYTVSFETNGGSEINSVSVTEGQSVNKPADPIRSGYVFGGWYADGDYEVEVKFPYAPESSVTVYAKWLNKFTITFNSNGGSEVSAITDIIEGTSVTLPSISREGFTFGGWYDSLEGGSRVAATYTPESDIILYAHWIVADATTYTVSYNTMGGTNLDADVVVEGESVTLPAAPVYAGHVFDGWYAEENYSGNKLEGTYTPESDITLYAKWLKEYTVTFETNGGSAVEAVKVVEGGSITEPTAPTYAGHVFGGWYADENYGEAIIFPYTPSANATIYIKWLDVYTISFETNGGNEINSVSVTEGQSINNPADPIRSGYEFGGWYADEDYEEAVTFPYTPVASVTLYAKWLEIYTVSFELNNVAASAMSSLSVTEGNSVVLPEPSRKGFTFGGWYETEDLSGDSVSSTYAPVSNTVLYAAWIPQEEYNLADGGYGDVSANREVWYYKVNNGSVSSQSQSAYNNGIITLYVTGASAKPTTVSSGEAIQLRYLPNLPVNTNFTVHFEVTVSVDGRIKAGLDNGSGESNILSATSVEKDTKYIAYYTGSVVADTGAANQYKPLMLMFFPSTDGDVTITVKVIYAGTEKTLDKYTVTFDTNGGEEIDAITEILEGASINLPVPVRSGYAFDGWYNNAELEGGSLSASYLPAQNITLYAKWVSVEEATTYTVTYNTNGGNELQSAVVLDGNSIELPVPVRDGYLFDGWYQSSDFSGDKLSGTLTPDDDVSLYAKWLKQHTVTFDTKGGSAVATIYVAEGNSISTLPVPTRKGFTFEGWFTNEQYSESVNTEYVPQTDIVLYAKWIEAYTIVQGSYGVVNQNREIWYYNLQGTQANATINEVTYNNGTINFDLTGVKQQTSVGNNAVQLRYLPDLAGEQTYTATVTITVTMDGIIKFSPDNRGQSQSITANTPTTLTYTGPIEWNANDNVYRPLLIQFYPGQDGDVTLTATDFSVTVPDPENYNIIYGLNSAVCNNPGTWYWFASTPSHVSSATYDHGIITLSCVNMDTTAYCLRYQPETYASAKTYYVTIKVKLSDGLNVEDYITVDGGKSSMTFSEADAEGFVTVTASYTLKSGTAYYIQFQDKNNGTTSLTMTVKDVVFTEA